jgi:DNA repair exonuclease SbcCD ATPase subunit
MMLLPLAIQVSILEIVLFQLGALLVGFVLSFVWNMRRAGNPKEDDTKMKELEKEALGWRMKYYDFAEKNQHGGEEVKQLLEDARISEQMIREELEETKELYQSLLKKQKVQVTETKPEEYLTQLKMAQDHLVEHNQSINKLLQQVEVIEQIEKKHQDSLQINEQLSMQLQLLKSTITEKESEIKTIRQQSELTAELKHQLETAYIEFNDLQSQLMKVENKLVQPMANVLKYDELEEANHILANEVNDLRHKYKELVETQSRLAQDLDESEAKLREANFQRQQLVKRNEFLEALTKDLQQVTDKHHKLESQMTRLSEMETLLAKLSAKTDQGHS